MLSSKKNQVKVEHELVLKDGNLFLATKRNGGGRAKQKKENDMIYKNS